VAARRAATASFARRLLLWFDTARRDLPWRRTRDPWAIWISEVMLQQTRVEAVRAPFERFLQRFPTPGAFASVGDDELLVAWRGLGYYRRARLLRDGARMVVRDHDGVVPASPERLAELPGIGDYTCGAVASIAFGAPPLQTATSNASSPGTAASPPTSPRRQRAKKCAPRLRDGSTRSARATSTRR